MNSLSELNYQSSIPLSYIDDRNAQVIFDRLKAVDQIVSIGTGQSHNAPNGIDILEIIKPTVMNTYFEVDVSSLAGATVDWPYVPPGLVVSNPSVGLYKIENIYTKEQWDAIKNPVVHIPVDQNDNFTYGAYIKYEPNKTQSWGVLVKVGIIAAMVSEATVTATSTFIASNIANLEETAYLNALSGKVWSRTVNATANATINPNYTRYRLFDTAMSNIFSSVVNGKIAFKTTPANVASLFTIIPTGKVTRNAIIDTTTYFEMLATGNRFRFSDVNALSNVLFTPSSDFIRYVPTGYQDGNSIGQSVGISELTSNYIDSASFDMRITVSGQPSYLTSTGRLYIWDPFTPPSTFYLTASNGSTGDQFGYSSVISSDGNRILAGAIGKDTNGSNSGSVYSIKSDYYYWTPNFKTQIESSPTLSGLTSYECGRFSTDGTNFYTSNYNISTSNLDLNQYSLSTPWDISTISFTRTKTLTNGGSNDPHYSSGNPFSFSNNGKFLYTVYSTNRIFQHSLSTPWDISTITYDNKMIQDTSLPAGIVDSCITEPTPFISATSGVTNSIYGITSNGTNLVIVGSGGLAMVGSLDGTTWTSYNSNTVSNLNSIAYGSSIVTYNNNLFVAVGDNGTIRTSPTGSSNPWTTRTSGTTNNLRRIFHYKISTNDHFIVVGDNGTILESYNGVDWTSNTSPTTNHLYSMAYEGTVSYTRLIVGQSGTILRDVITGGWHWETVSSGTTNNLNDVTIKSSPQGVKIHIAVGDNGIILTSTDAINWTQRTSGTTENLKTIYQTDHQFVIIGTNGVMLTSSDGISWVLRSNYFGTKTYYGMYKNTSSGLTTVVGQTGSIKNGSEEDKLFLLLSNNSIRQYFIPPEGNIQSIAFVSSFTDSTNITSGAAITFSPDSKYLYIKDGYLYKYTLSIPGSISTATYNEKSTYSIGGSVTSPGVIHWNPNGYEFLSGGNSNIISKRTTNEYWSEETILSQSTPGANNQFGYYISSNKALDQVLISAPSTSTLGKVDYFTRSGTTWTNASHFSASDGTTNDGFGKLIRTSSDMTYAMVTSNSAVYVFTRSGTTWTQQQKISITPTSAEISAMGTYLFISDKTANSNMGAIYIYKRSGTVWSLYQTINGSGTNVNLGLNVCANSNGDRLFTVALDSLGLNYLTFKVYAKQESGFNEIFTRTDLYSSTLPAFTSDYVSGTVDSIGSLYRVGLPSFKNNSGITISLYGKLTAY